MNWAEMIRARANQRVRSVLAVALCVELLMFDLPRPGHAGPRAWAAGSSRRVCGVLAGGWRFPPWRSRKHCSEAARRAACVRFARRRSRRDLPELDQLEAE